MGDVKELQTYLACPRCDKTPLASSDGAYRCDACKVDFPSIDGIPWLFAEPQATLGEWRGRLQFALQKLGHEAARLDAELRNEDLRPLTRRRIERYKKVLKELEESETGFSRKLWESMAGLGWMGIIVPEASDRGELKYPFGMMDQFPLQMPVSSKGKWFQGWPLIPWLLLRARSLRDQAVAALDLIGAGTAEEDVVAGLFQQMQVGLGEAADAEEQGAESEGAEQRG